MTLALTALFLVASAAAAVWLAVCFLRQEDMTAPRLLWTAFLGLCAFFFLESGLCRRIGLDLFLPVQKDAALPWRALRLGLCVDLALAAGIWGGGVREKLRVLLRRDAGCWLAAAAVTAVFFLWAWRVTVFTFMTNDDTSILRAVGSGSFWRLTSAYPHPLMNSVMSRLYHIAPDVSWYAGYHLAVQAAAMTILGRCLLLKMRRRRWPIAAGPLIQWLLGTGLFLYTLSELSFTVTPAIAGTAAAALILCLDETDSAPGCVLAGLASVALMLLCRLQREDTWSALCCFCLLAAGYQLLRAAVYKRPGRLLRTGTILTAALLTVALLSAVERVQPPASTAPAEAADASNSPAGTADVSGYSYSSAEHYRSQVMDYLLDKLTDEQLEAVGIPPELALLLRGWYFMDERINTDTFRTITETYSNAVSNAASAAADDGAPLAGLESMIAVATGNMTPARRHTAALMTAALGLLLALALLRLLRYGLAGWTETLCALCAAGGAALMLLYLIREGRLLIRVFLVPAIPAAAFLLLMVADMPDKPACTRLRKAGAFLSCVTGLLLGALCLLIAESTPYADQAVDRQDVFGGQIAAENYVNAHPDITFITNALANDVDPFHDPWSYPSNLTRWGGTGVTANPDRLYADAFFRDDVQLLCEQPSTVVGLLQYLSLDFGPVQARIAAQLTPKLSVADISQITPGEEYTGWYGQNGMTYYFRNGQALTGEQTIDGETYTFAPAGAASQFAAAPSPDGILYYTDAYSLIVPEERPA